MLETKCVEDNFEILVTILEISLTKYSIFFNKVQKMSPTSIYSHQHLQIELHRCWLRMLVTQCVGGNFEIWVTVLAVFVISILFLLTWVSSTNIQKMSPISLFYHQDQKIVNNVKSQAPTCHRYFWHRKLTPTLLLPLQLKKMILKVINQEGKDEQMKQWLYICGSIIGAALVIVTAMKLYWHCMKK